MILGTTITWTQYIQIQRIRKLELEPNPYTGVYTVLYNMNSETTIVEQCLLYPLDLESTESKEWAQNV